MMKIKTEEIPNVSLENCKNTKIKNGWKKIKCVCGSTRIKARVVAEEGEGAGEWLELSCKKCNRTLFYNGA